MTIRLGLRTGLRSGTQLTPYSRLPIGHIFIKGQSNALGQGQYNTVDFGLDIGAVFSSATIDTASSFTPPSVQPRRSMQPYAASGVPNMGPELSLARFLIRNGAASPTLPISKLGVNGSDIDTWILAANFNRSCNYIDVQSAATGVAMTDMVWIQGEADAADAAKSAAYLTRLETLHSAYRARYGIAYRLWIIRLNAAATASPITTAWRNAVRAAEETYCANHSSNTFLIDVDFIPMSADNVHYTGEGYVSLGNAIGNAMVSYLRDIGGVGSAPWIQDFSEPTAHSDSASVQVVPRAEPARDGDCQLLITSTAGNNVTPALAAAAGFLELTNSPQVSLSGGVREWCAVYYRFVTQAALNAAGGVRLVDPTVDAGNQRRNAKIITLRGMATNSSAFHLTQGHVNNAFSTSMSIPGIITTENNCLILYIHCCYSSSSNALSSVANSTLPDFAVVFDSYFPTQQKITVMKGTKTIAGPTGTATGTHAATSLQANMVIAIKPP